MWAVQLPMCQLGRASGWGRALEQRGPGICVYKLGAKWPLSRHGSAQGWPPTTEPEGQAQAVAAPGSGQGSPGLAGGLRG